MAYLARVRSRPAVQKILAAEASLSADLEAARG
jgi:glutathione S-transferase